MIKYEKKIKGKKRIYYKKPVVILLNTSNRIGDWVFCGYMSSGEPIWYNDIDDYTYIRNMN